MIKSHLPALFLVCLAVVIAYFGVWNFKFVYDDYAHLVDNEIVHSLTPIHKFFVDPSAFTGGGNPSVWRPIAAFVAAVSWQVFGDSPSGYHAINLVLHLINTAIFYWIFFIIFKNKIVAASAATIFALHPTTVEAVTWVASQNTLLFTGFFLAALLLIFLKKWKVISVVLFFLSLLTKETAIVSPLIIFAAYWLRDKNGVRREKSALLSVAPYIYAEAVYLFLRYSFVERIAGGEAFSQLQIVPVTIYTYLKAVLWPVNLFVLDAIPRDRFTPESFFDYRLILGTLIFILAVWAAVYLYKRRFDLELFGLIWFFVFLAPVIQIIPTPGVLGARVLYLPLVGLLLFLTSFLLRMVERKDAAKKISIFIICGLVVFLGIITFRTNKYWTNSEVFWERFLEKFPDSSVAAHNLSAYYLKHGYDPGIAGSSSKELFALWQGSSFLRILSGQALPGDFEITEKRFLELLDKNPDDEVTSRNLQLLQQIKEQKNNNK